MRRTRIALLLMLGGCAPPGSAARPTTPLAVAAAHTVDAAHAEPASAAETIAAQRERIRELEAQLGLAEASHREVAGEVEALRARERSQAVRLGGHRAGRAREAEVLSPIEIESDEVGSDEDGASLAEDGLPSVGPGGRPVLRLHGPAPRAAMSVAGVTALPGPAAPLIVGAPPPGSLRLPVMTSAEAEAGVPMIPALPIAVAPGAAYASNFATSTSGPALLLPAPSPAATRAVEREDPAAAEYRAALRHLAEHRPADALVGIEAFLRRHPDHSYADNAVYWQGEIHYTRRDYARALSIFSTLIERYPRGNKVPDALLRIGLCYRRLGEGTRATRVFDRLREQFPESVAARLAPQEDA